jgi:hypothetical protein
MQSQRVGPSATADSVAPTVGSDSPALRYAKAIQDGKCDEIIEMTAWMAERLERLRLEANSPEALQQERQRLCDAIRAGSDEGNRLTREGIEDAYVFAQGATWEPVAVDTGRTDLDQPVLERTWLKVTYPDAARAPRDLSGKPIRILAAGVNVSAEGRILKAAIVGNLDIDWVTISNDWAVVAGG